MKKVIFIVAMMSLVACSKDHSNSRSATPAGPGQQEKVDATQQTTQNLTENDFCVVDMFGRVSKTLNFDYTDAYGVTEQWMTWKDMDVQGDKVANTNTGRWAVNNDEVTITDPTTNESVVYKAEWTEQDGTVTGVKLNPEGEDQKDYKAEYEVCGIKDVLARKAQIKALVDFHEKHGM